jgi:hypothetical protein
MIWTGQQYIDLMTFRGQPRQFFAELFGPLVGLPEEWRAQGASEEEIDLTAFMFDRLHLANCGVNTGYLHPMEEVVLQENEGEVIVRDSMGRTSKLRKGFATIGLPMDWPVKTMADWQALRHQYAYHPSRVDAEAAKKAAEARAQGALVGVWIPGGYATVRDLMGDEEACVAFIEEPDMIHDMLGTFADTATRVLREINRYVMVDHIHVHEDMAGKSGPLLGPKQIREFIKPYYRGVWDLAYSNGARLFSQDSDGNMNAVIEPFIACGVNVFYPCEPAAGMDIVALRKQYGKAAAFKGGIDKHVLRRSRADIDQELAYKLQPLMQEGGMVFALDHRIPNGTPLAAYRYYVKQARSLLGLPEKEEKGWMRMAF